MSKKYCCKCDTWKTLKNFRRHAGHKDGYQTPCKQCLSQKSFKTIEREKLKLFGKKECVSCKNILSLDQFYISRGQITNGQISGSCKSCICNKNRKKYAENDELREAKNKYAREKARIRKDDWVEFFKKMYGSNPKCGICQLSLVYHSDVVRAPNSVIWDHRTEESSRLISASPSEFIKHHVCNVPNQEIWIKANFGILCNFCNRFLPTKGRAERVKAIVKYTQIQDMAQQELYKAGVI